MKTEWTVVSWISVKDMLPVPHTIKLVCDGCKVSVAVNDWSGNWHFMVSDIPHKSDTSFGVTHWSELPNGPV